MKTNNPAAGKVYEIPVLPYVLFSLHVFIHCPSFHTKGGRRGDFKVSALDSGASSLGSALTGYKVDCSWARHFTLTVPLSTQVYKQVHVPANLMVGITCDGLASHPEGRRNTTTVVASCYSNWDKLHPDGPQLVCMQTLPTYHTKAGKLSNEHVTMVSSIHLQSVLVLTANVTYREIFMI